MKETRFLHTADWQLGLRRHFLSEEALPRYRQARIDAIRTMAAIAREESCEFALVCGDAFESNQIDRGTLGRAQEALAEFPCPVFLLPGNHDPCDAATVYRHFRDHPRARVLASAEPVEVRPGVEVLGAPWFSKRPAEDPVAAALAGLGPAPHLRVLCAHGDAGLAGDHGGGLDLALVRTALGDGRLHYAALGDRHSVTEVCERVWYSGTPEPTAFREGEPGFALVVDLSADACTVARRAVGRWRFVEKAWTVADVDALERWLDAVADKDRTVLKLELQGSLAPPEKACLDDLLAGAAHLFAGLQVEDGVVLEPGAWDLALTGFARAAADDLLARGDPAARDALTLLHRLAGGGAR